MDTSDNGYSIFKLIHASPGMAYLGRKKLRSFTLNVFSMNKIELQNDLSILQSPEIGVKLMSEEYRSAGHQVHRELNRRFHNYLAAAKTLVDHTRAFVAEHYKGTKIDEDYQAEVARTFVNNELCRFMQDIRNYALHRELPISNMTLKFTRAEGIRTGVFIETEQLRKWDGWTSASNAFLARQDVEIDPVHIVNSHASIVETFHQWFDGALAAYHQRDLDELRVLEEEQEKIQRGS
ncbi:hypothetical protein [Tardiphaga sp. 813_E8_N1_3]|uniref:hypothetical protein n=1 Tax=Tardiphaga sp. 813_E8_N1_3 TaxID=3240760 RepID=UPI003F294D0D